MAYATALDIFIIICFISVFCALAEFALLSFLDLYIRWVKVKAMSEKFLLQWNDFKANKDSAFGRLRDDKEFIDVTLVCDDGQQMEAHKVILAASSPFFETILQRKNGVQ